MQNKYQKDHPNHKSSISISNDITIGNPDQTIFISGPCSVESIDQLEVTAENLIKNNIKIIRAGCFKPRTNPYSFFGLGSEGLDLLCDIRSKYGLKIITEVRDSSHVDEVIEKSDIVQIGAKAMWDYGIMEACGKSNKPVLLKRHFGATVTEFCKMAEFILNYGNENVVLCERGIRSFGTETRFTLDVCGIEWLKANTHLPIIVDPSHAMGYRYAIKNLVLASLALNVDGIMIESHPSPENAKSDADQQIPLCELESIIQSSKTVLSSINKELI
ncbi:MAG: 3-deoxy-7-phosphoheptulonate synthase [Thermodesulfobacteriota bacterium]|nr:3-deoxy-7-phosphoheptulonate synthase [Thermodesulfobacteriota bacterium]